MDTHPLTTTASLCLDHPGLDAMNHTLLALLAEAKAADEAALPQAWSALLAHSAAHFAQEEAWMRTTRLATAAQHQLQHRVVLRLLREGLVLARQGQVAPVREMARDMESWFARHTQSQDAALALHLKRRQPRPAANKSATPHPGP